jgi:acetyl-CoA acyltransferase
MAKYTMAGGNKKGMKGVQAMLKEAGPVATWLPQPNSISERSTGKTMGYHADLMAELNKVPRTNNMGYI